MTATFPASQPSVRFALKWLSEQIQNPLVTSVLKHHVTALRFERAPQDVLILVLDGEVSAKPLERHADKIVASLKQGYLVQGGIILSDVRIEIP